MWKYYGVSIKSGKFVISVNRGNIYMLLILSVGWFVISFRWKKNMLFLLSVELKYGVVVLGGGKYVFF